MKKTLGAIALGLAAWGVAPASFAQYVGFGFGPSRIDINCAGTVSCDKNGFGGKFYGGWNVAPPWAAEVAYFNWGKADSASAPGGGTATLDTKAWGIGVGAAYTIMFAPGQRCHLRLGIVRNKADTTTTLNGVGASSSHNFTAPYAGGDCAIPISSVPNLWGTAGVDYSRIKYTAQDKADVLLFTVGLRWN